MKDVIATLWPEITLFAALTVVLIVGLAKTNIIRQSTTLITAIGLFAAFAVAILVQPPTPDSPLPGLAQFVAPVTAFIGLLTLLGMGAIDREYEDEIVRGRTFDPLDTARGEFLAFYMLSLIGVMLTATSRDLIWAFLALELTSLPTYIMVALSRPRDDAKEAALKYFFLGAMSTAVFLFGFALIYGATGSMHFLEIREALFAQAAVTTGEISMLAQIGIVLAIVGVSFKIAAVPMHFYTPDVYEGAAAPVSAFLAFVPKTAGFIVIMLLASLVVAVPLPGVSGDVVGLPAVQEAIYPPAVHAVLWVVAVLTMTVGNVLALVQRSIKRILAYSSIAHSGYVLIGVLAGPQLFAASSPAEPILGSASANGFAAVLFYLLAYGVTNLGPFLVVAALERRGEEIDDLDDLRGLRLKYPVLMFVLALCSLSLLGLPPLVGFWGKLYLFQAGIASGEIALVVIAGLNSAISGWYYLKLAGLGWLSRPTTETAHIQASPHLGVHFGAVLSAVAVLILAFLPTMMIVASHRASGLAPDGPQPALNPELTELMDLDAVDDAPGAATTATTAPAPTGSPAPGV